MNLAVFLLLLAITAAAFFFGKKKILDPWFMLCTMFLLCTCMTLINAEKWRVHYTPVSAAALMMPLLCFGLGSFAASLFTRRTKYILLPKLRKDFAVANLEKIRFRVMFFLSLAASLVYLYGMVKMNGQYHLADSFFRNIYEAVVKGASPGFLYNQMISILCAACYLVVFLMFRDKRTRDPFAYLTILLYLFCAVVSTDRNKFVRLILYFLFLWLYFNPLNVSISTKRDRKKTRRTVYALMLAAGGALLFFFALGKLKSYSRSFADSISLYLGSGINLYRIYADAFTGENLTLGQESFYTIVDMFRAFGLPLPDLSSFRFESFYTYKGAGGYVFSSNVYTALKRYMADFGYAGITLIPFFVGMFYRWLFVKAERSGKGMSVMFYAKWVYPLLYFPILEQLFTRIHLGSLYENIYLLLFYIFL